MSHGRLLLLIVAMATIALVVAGNASASTARNGKIAFAAGNEDASELYTVNPDGTHLIRLTTDSSPDNDPAWSPSGQQLAWSRGGRIYVFDAAGIRSRLLAESDGYLSQPTWSRNGRVVYAIESQEDGSGNPFDRIVRIDAASGKTSNLTPATRSDIYYKMRDARRILLGPDGALFASLDLKDCGDLGLTPGPAFEICSGMFSLGLDAATPKALWTSGAELLGSLPWYDLSPDGTLFATDSAVSSGNGRDVVILNATGNVVRNLSSNANYVIDSVPVLSPDGTLVMFAHSEENTLFQREHGAPFSLMSSTTDGSGKRPVGGAFSSITALAWQPQPQPLDLTAPAVKTFPSAGRAGETARLQLSVDEASRVTAEDVKIFDGPRRVDWFGSPYEATYPGRSSYRWMIPASKRGHRLRFCVFSADRMGNRSATSCSPLRAT